MPEMITISKEELAHLEERVKKLAMDKSYLQLIIHLMSRLSTVTGLENTVENMLKSVLESIGGTNLIVYYVIDDDFYYMDVFGKTMKVAQIEDMLVERVFETREFIEHQQDFTDTRMLTPEFARATTWVFPLLVGSDIIGVFKMEGMHIEIRGLQDQLQVFFSYAALILKNEMLGYTRLKKAYDQIEEEVIERKRAERALRESQQMLQSILDTIPVGVFWKDVHSTYLGCNRAFALDAGLQSADEIVGRSDFDMVWAADAERYRADDRKVLESDERKIGYEEPLTKSGGNVFWVRTSKVPLLDSENKVKGVLGTYEDITVHRRTEEELQRIQKLESIGVLAGGMAHDFNNLLGIILGNICLAQLESSPSTGKFNRILKEAERACLRSKNLTQQLITFARGGAPLRGTEPVRRIVENVIELALAGSTARCELRMAQDLWSVYCDCSQIQQALISIVVNAKEAVGDGGSIEIDAKNVRIVKDDIPCVPGGDFVVISVKDHGTGIRDEHLPKIFDPYFSTKERGTEKGMGLGLTIAYSIIKRHDGYIGVESLFGAGATFHIYLPASDAGLIAPTEGDVKEAGPVVRRRVLVMDDEKMHREMVGQMLRSMGYEAELAQEGREATQIFRQAKDAGKAFDVVILDLTVRGGMGGLEAVEGLLDIDPSVKAVVSSGYSNDPVISDFKTFGFSGVLVKPYGIGELKARLDILCGTNERAGI